MVHGQFQLPMHTVLRCHGNIPSEDYEKITLPSPSAFQRLHNDTHVPCSLQSPHSEGIGMITSIRNCPWTVQYMICVLLHPYIVLLGLGDMPKKCNLKFFLNVWPILNLFIFLSQLENEFSLFSSLSFGFKYPVRALCVLLWLSCQWQFGIKQMFVFSYF